MYDIMMYLWYSHRPVQERDSSCHGLDLSLPEYEDTTPSAPAATISLSYPESAGAPTNAELPKELSENIDVYVSVQYEVLFGNGLSVNLHNDSPIYDDFLPFLYISLI